jgi:hypothetical protein
MVEARDNEQREGLLNAANGLLLRSGCDGLWCAIRMAGVVRWLGATARTQPYIFSLMPVWISHQFTG